jgi:hypothetical protein
MRTRALLYTRDLPGGGYVAIDLLPPAGDAQARLRLWVERRADPTRRPGHSPPVLLEAEAPDPDAALLDLRRIAADNVMLAQEILRWQRKGRA